MLVKNSFFNVVKNTPLVSIDLVVRSPDDRILMGMRVNQPAAGYWFVPGGVIFKNETLEVAFQRISEAELGHNLSIEQGKLLGAFTHLYDTNFAGKPGVGTHYVVLAYELQLSFELETLPAAQHSNYRWIGREENAANLHQNSMVYFDYLSSRK